MIEVFYCSESHAKRIITPAAATTKSRIRDILYRAQKLRIKAAFQLLQDTQLIGDGDQHDAALLRDYVRVFPPDSNIRHLVDEDQLWGSDWEPDKAEEAITEQQQAIAHRMYAEFGFAEGNDRLLERQFHA